MELRKNISKGFIWLLSRVVKISDEPRFMLNGHTATESERRPVYQSFPDDLYSWKRKPPSYVGRNKSQYFSWIYSRLPLNLANHEAALRGMFGKPVYVVDYKVLPGYRDDVILHVNPKNFNEFEIHKGVEGTPIFICDVLEQCKGFIHMTAYREADQHGAWHSLSMKISFYDNKDAVLFRFLTA